MQRTPTKRRNLSTTFTVSSTETRSSPTFYAEIPPFSPDAKVMEAAAKAEVTAAASVAPPVAEVEVVASATVKRRPKASTQKLDVPPIPADISAKPRSQQASAWYRSAKSHMACSRNLHTDIKIGVTNAIDNLYRLAKEAEAELEREREKNQSASSTVLTASVTAPVIADVGAANGVTLADIKEVQKQIQAHIKENAVILEDIRKAQVHINNNAHSNAAIISHIEEVKDKIHEVTTTMEEVKEKTGPSLTYAQAAAAAARPREINPTPPIAPKTKPALVVSSKKNVLSSAETFRNFKDSVSFRDTTFAPANVKYISKNKIRVEFDNANHRDETLEKLKRPECSVVAEASKTLSPMVVLKGVSQDISADELVGILKNQNPEVKNAIVSDGDLIFRFKRGNRNKQLYNAVFMTSPPVWKAITSLVKLNIDYHRVHAEDYVPLLQCYKCLQFGHTKARCDRQVAVCSHCSLPGHEFRSCPEKNDTDKAQCHNCVEHAKINNTKCKIDHSATSQECPRISFMLQTIRSRTDYGY